MVVRPGPEIYIDQPTANGSATAPTLTVTGHLGGAAPDGATVTCKLYDPSGVTSPTATITGISIGPVPNYSWSCQFTNVQPTAQNQQAGVTASLISGSTDLADVGPVLFTILGSQQIGLP